MFTHTLLLFSTLLVAVVVSPFTLSFTFRPKYPTNLQSGSSGWRIRRFTMSQSSSSKSNIDGTTNDHTPNDNDEHTNSNTLVYPISAIDRLNESNKKGIWSDRIALQNSFTLLEKGWQVHVEWKISSQCSGIGVFATQYIPANTILRIGILYDNLLPLYSVHDIETFCQQQNDGSSQYFERLQYIQDYLWGYYPSNLTDTDGYFKSSSNDDKNEDTDERFFGMWVPGNGLNHNAKPNTLYRNDDHFTTHTGSSGGNEKKALYLVALQDIHPGDELFDDYRRHGSTPPLWLKEYASENFTSASASDSSAGLRVTEN